MTAIPSTADVGATTDPDAPEDAETARCRRNGRWLGVITVLMTATQLRAAGGVGPFEVLLVVYMGLTLPPGDWGLRSWRLFPGKLLAVILVFGSIGGAYSALVLGEDEPLSVLLATAPYILVLVTIEYVLGHSQPATVLRSWAAVFGTLLALVFLALLLVYAAGLNSATPFEIYLDGVRFQAWMSNPNQASSMIVIAYVVFAKTVSRSWPRAAMVGAVALVGLATRSDGMRLSFIVALPVMATLILLFYGRSTQSELRWRFVAVSSLVLGAVLVWWLLPTIVDTATEVSKSGDQGSERLDLWEHCWYQTQRSPLFGLGPTPHSLELAGEPQECHSSLFDLAVTAGLPALAAYLLVTIRQLWHEVEKRSLWGICFVVQISVMMLFNFYLRYPQLWLAFFLLAIESAAKPADVAQTTEAERPISDETGHVRA